MKLIDASPLIVMLWSKRPADDDHGAGQDSFRNFCDGMEAMLRAAPTISCERCKCWPTLSPKTCRLCYGFSNFKPKDGET